MKTLVERLSRSPREEQAEILKHLSYVASITANIRQRLDAFDECIVDQSDLIQIWAQPWVDLPGNFKNKMEGMAADLDADVVKLNKNEWKFYRKRHCIVVH